MGLVPYARLLARAAVLGALAVLALPHAAAATVYDQYLYDELVRNGTTPREARCAAALSGARVSLERYLDGYFVAVVLDDPAIAPNANPQETDEGGNYSWEIGDGEYRVSVTKTGYWRAFSGIIIGPSAVFEEHVALKRRPGTAPPEPRDCDHLSKPEPEPDDRDPSGTGDDADPEPTCLLRPVDARVRGGLVRKVLFTLDGRVIKRASRPDGNGVYGVTVERTTLPRGKHVLRAKVIFVRRADRRPEVLRLVIRRCPERLAPKLAKADTPRCVERPFLAWVRANRVRRVHFRLDGRKLKTVSVADWRGRYGVRVRPGQLRKGPHVVNARIEFLRDSGLEDRTVRLRFRNCG